MGLKSKTASIFKILVLVGSGVWSTCSYAEIISIDRIAFRYKNLGWWESVVPNNPMLGKPANSKFNARFLWWIHNDDEVIKIFHKDINERGFAADRILVSRIAMGITRAGPDLAREWYSKVKDLYGSKAKCEAFIQRQRKPGIDYISDHARAKAWLLRSLIKASNNARQSTELNTADDELFAGLYLYTLLAVKYGDTEAETILANIEGIYNEQTPIAKTCDAFIKWNRSINEDPPPVMGSIEEFEKVLLYVFKTDVKLMVYHHFGPLMKKHGIPLQ